MVSILDDIFRGFILMSFFALTQHGCTLDEIAEHAAKKIKQGPMSYSAYTRALTGYKSKK